MLTHAHSYAPKLQAPGQPSNEGRIYTALTLSLYSTESHGQGDTQLAGASGHHSALYAGLTAPLRGVGGSSSAKPPQAQRAPWGAPCPHRQTTHRPDNPGIAELCPGRLGTWGFPCPPSCPPTAAPQPYSEPRIQRRAHSTMGCSRGDQGKHLPGRRAAGMCARTGACGLGVRLQPGREGPGGRMPH